ncbi:FtsX-like permease family protein [Oerskovia flava]|uniref:FtsX-like permease family protein n=1 Tax=Oerskovia flava TaxID=2986422 RepID=UPI002240C650|nr:FtsX-like permease family protein [Oerskovia sp. JB1-3-2]
MSRGGLIARRARAQLGLLVTIFLLAAGIAGAVGGTVGYVQSASVAAARDGLAAVDPTGRALQVQTRLAADPLEQDARVRAAVAAHFPGVPLDVVRTLRTEPLDARLDAESEPVRLVLDVDPAASGTTGLDLDLDGDPPSTSGTAPTGVLHAGAAEALGVQRDDVLTIESRDGETDVVVGGTWRASDVEAGSWFGDRLALTGVDEALYGPLLVDEATLDLLGTAPFVRWTLVPRLGELDPDALTTVAAGAQDLRTTLRGDDAVAVRGLTVQGELGTTAAVTGATVQAAAAVTLVPLALLALVSLVAMVQVARLLAQTRATEVALLVARGASVRQLSVSSAAEATMVVGVGALVGTLVALGVLRVVLPAGASMQVAATWTGGAVVALVAVAALTAVAALQARRLVRRTATDRSGRTRRAAAAGTVLLTTAAGVLCLWQLRRYGSPLVEVDGVLRVDPLAVLAPAVCLAALAVVVTAVLGPVTATTERVAGRGRGTVLPLAARQVSRRLAVYVVPVVLVTLAVGSTVLAAAYAGTSAQLRAGAGELRNGADVRITFPASGPVSATRSVPAAEPFAALDGAAAATNVLKLPGAVGEDAVTITALAAASLPAVMTSPDGSTDLAGTADVLAPGSLPGAAVPEAATSLTLDVRAAAAVDWELYADSAFFREEAQRARELRTTLWLRGEDGTLHLVAADMLSLDYGGTGSGDVGERPSTHEVTAELPGTGPWTIVALDVAADLPWLASDLTYEVEGVTAGTPDGTTEVDLAGSGPWEVAPDLSSTAAAELDPVGELGFSGLIEEPGAVLGVRFLPDGALPPAPLPVVVSAGLAERLAAEVGDDLDVTVSGTALVVTVAGVVDAIPGALEPLAAVADLPSTTDRLLRSRQTVPQPEQVWLAASPGADVDVLAQDASALARESLGVEAETSTAAPTAGADAATPVRNAFWLASAGAVLLALAGVLAVVVALLRDRRSEVMVLRALGVPPRRQARSRQLELLGVTGAATALGALAGWATATATVPLLALVTTRDVDAVLPAPLVVQPAGVAAGVAVLAAGLVLVAGVTGARVRAQALDSEYREEIR